jgi:hypothetical protein
MRGCARTRRRATFGASDGEGFGRHRASHGPKAGHPAASFWMYVGPRQKEKGPAVSHSAGPSHGYQARLLAIRTRGIECTRRNERAVQYGAVGPDIREQKQKSRRLCHSGGPVAQRLWSGRTRPVNAPARLRATSAPSAPRRAHEARRRCTPGLTLGRRLADSTP